MARVLSGQKHTARLRPVRSAVYALIARVLDLLVGEFDLFVLESAHLQMADIRLIGRGPLVVVVVGHDYVQSSVLVCRAAGHSTLPWTAIASFVSCSGLARDCGGGVGRRYGGPEGEARGEEQWENKECGQHDVRHRRYCSLTDRLRFLQDDVYGTIVELSVRLNIHIHIGAFRFTLHSTDLRLVTVPPLCWPLGDRQDPLFPFTSMDLASSLAPLLYANDTLATLIDVVPPVYEEGTEPKSLGSLCR